LRIQTDLLARLSLSGQRQQTKEARD